MNGKGYSGAVFRGVVAPPRWMADEMVGRLARYLRIVGCDTAYARGLADDEIVRIAGAEDRIVLTRDRELAAKAKQAFLLESPQLADQWRAVRSAFPEVPMEPRFERCTECNGRLVPAESSARNDADTRVPWDRVAAGLKVFRCESCGHPYWEGTHTADVRARIAEWEKRSAR